MGSLVQRGWGIVGSPTYTNSLTPLVLANPCHCLVLTSASPETPSDARLVTKQRVSLSKLPHAHLSIARIGLVCPREKNTTGTLLKQQFCYNYTIQYGKKLYSCLLPISQLGLPSKNGKCKERHQLHVPGNRWELASHNSAGLLFFTITSGVPNESCTQEIECMLEKQQLYSCLKHLKDYPGPGLWWGSSSNKESPTSKALHQRKT